MRQALLNPAEAIARRSPPYWQRATALVMCVAGTLGGCTEGYPTSDTPHRTPVQMTTAERTREMNRLGEDAGAQRLWRYSVHEHCALAITVRRHEAEEQSFIARLSGQQVEMVSDKATASYRVQSLPSLGGHSEATVLFEAEQWTDAAEMASLIQAQRRECLRRAPLGKHPNTAPSRNTAP